MKITLTGFVHGKQKETNKKTTNQAKKNKAESANKACLWQIH